MSGNPKRASRLEWRHYMCIKLLDKGACDADMITHQVSKLEKFIFEEPNTPPESSSQSPHDNQKSLDAPEDKGLDIVFLRYLKEIVGRLEGELLSPNQTNTR